MRKIHKGDRLHFKPEYMEPGDAGRVFYAIEDSRPGCASLRYKTLLPAGPRLPLEPINTCAISMIDRAEPYLNKQR